MVVHPHRGSPSASTSRTGRSGRKLAAAVVALVLGAGIAGVFIGRATTGGAETAALASWTALPTAPIAGRDSPVSVWTGKELLVYGGMTAKPVRAGPCDRSASDGAAYDPASGTWRAIAPSPAGVCGGSGSAVWTGHELVVWASHSPDGPVGAAAYDPSTDTWRTLPAGPLGRRESYGLAWTGEELIVVGGNRGDALAEPVAAALDPRTGSWRLLPALNRLDGLYPPGPGTIWDGREVFILSSICAGQPASSCSPAMLAYDPAADALRTIDLARAPVVPAQQLTVVGLHGHDLVFSAAGVPTSVNAGKAVIVTYDPTTGRWQRGTFSPYPVPEGTQTAWLGARDVVADGSSGLQVYDLGTDTWQTTTPGPSPLNYRSGSAIAWTGSELIAWSGSPLHAHTGTPPLDDGASLALDG